MSRGKVPRTEILAQDTNGHPDTFHFSYHSHIYYFMVPRELLVSNLFQAKRLVGRERERTQSREAKLSQNPSTKASFA